MTDAPRLSLDVGTARRLYPGLPWVAWRGSRVAHVRRPRSAWATGPGSTWCGRAVGQTDFTTTAPDTATCCAACLAWAKERTASPPAHT